MVRNDVGTLVVVEGHGSNRPIGVLTDRDITVRCVATELDASSAPVQALMSAPPRVIAPDRSLEEALTEMAKAGTRRLVVTDEDGHLVGLLSLDDILEQRAAESLAVQELLRKQHPRVPA